MNRRSFLRLSGTALASGTFAGCSSGSAGPKTVEMTDDFRFVPETVSIERGGAVKWTNASSIEHTVTAYENGIPPDAAYFASGGFDSEKAARENLEAGLIGSDESYRHAFEVTGEYEYYCIPHEGSGMTGTVRVKG